MSNKQEGKSSTGVLIKSSFWYTVSSFLTRAMAFITTPIFTRILTKEQYGNFTVYASWQQILLVICGLEVYATLNRARFDYSEGNDYDAYISTSLSLSTLITGVVFLIYLIFPEYFYRVLLVDHKYMLIMFLYLFSYPALGVFQAKQRIEYKYKLSAGLSFFLVVFSSLTAITLVHLMSDDRLWGRVIGQYALYIITGITFYIYFLKRCFSIRPSYYKYILRIAIPLVFSYLGSKLLMSSDNLVVKHLCSAEEVSYLSITHTCTHIVLIFVQTINNAWAPWFYDKLSIKNYSSIRKVFSGYVWLIIIGTFGVLTIAPEIIIILGGISYIEALQVLPANILNGFFTVLSVQFVNYEVYHKKPQYAAIITGIVAVLNVALDIVGVKIWGYQAACYVTVFCQVLLITIHFCVCKKMDISRLLPMKDVIVFIGAAIILIPVALILYQSNIGRYLAIGIIAVLVIVALFIKREFLINMIQKVRKK